MSTQPFENIKVVEFGQFVAVPFCGQLLAEGGAEVIKIESPEGDPNRHMGEVVPFESRIFISRNRGKHALPLKLSDVKAKPVIESLLNWADVVLMNFRPGLAVRMGIDAATLIRRFPRLIIGEITPFGKQGPDANLSAMDIVVQARSGLMAAMGRIVDGRPAPGDPVISDYMAAMSLAFGISSALFRRERTGRGGVVDVSLMQSAMTLANNQLHRSEDLDREKHLALIKKIDQQRIEGASYEEQNAGLPSARMFPLRSVYFRTYETADGSIAIACASRGLQIRFSSALGFTDINHDPVQAETPDNGYYQSLKLEVEATLRGKDSSEWLKILKKAGVPVSTVKFPVELFEDPQTQANEMFYLLDHPTAGKFRALTPPVKLDGEGFQAQGSTAPFATETRSLLLELGFTTDQINTLISQQVTLER
jgi:crotonobetainyl-CoA:carnitine CoA-transferase CaiB-like acyl-CoA transferase